MRKRNLVLAVLCVALSSFIMAADIYVPADYATIQAAIDAAHNGDIIHVSAGLYHERLTIHKSISIIGESRDTCVISDSVSAGALISIETDSVTIANLEINGGYINGETKIDYSKIAISAEDTHVKLYNLQTKRIFDAHIKIWGGSCEADDIILNQKDISHPANIGLHLIECDATIHNLVQTNGHIVTTVACNWDNPNLGVKTVLIDGCTIRAYDSDWGACIRSFGHTNITVTNCYLYMEPDGDAADHTKNVGISIEGPECSLTSKDNTIDGVPWGIHIYGYLNGGNSAMIEGNVIQNCGIGGIKIMNADYNIADLGGGAFGSKGLNSFNNNATYNIMLENASYYVMALNNIFPDSDIDDGIWDKLDDSALGRVIYQMEYLIRVEIIIPIDGAQDIPWPPVLYWGLVQGSLFYFVQICERPDFLRNIEEATVFGDTTFTPKNLVPGGKYYWRVRAANYITQGPWSDIATFSIASSTAVDSAGDVQAPEALVLAPPYPNPFNATTTIEYSIPKATEVRIELFDVRGRFQKVIYSGRATAGSHKMTWKADGLASGVYMLRISAGDYARTQKIILLR